MKFRTEIPLAKAQNQIDYSSQILILGSCFAENIGSKFGYFKFQILQNPFGILFHLLAIEKFITKAVQKELYSDTDVFFLNNRWHCFDAHSDLSDTSKEKLLENLNAKLEETYNQIVTATHICITMGTAWVYRNSKSSKVVANCHKLPQKEFSKELLSVEEIQKSLENTIKSIQSLNKKVQFIFTVSPVRHLKDGYIENQRSKAHLITGLQKLLNSPVGGQGVGYYPSYEIMMDELRDYRFYKTDMVHPNQLAIDYIWEKFVVVWVAEKAIPSMEKIDSIQKGLQHRPFNPSSEKHLAFLKSLEKKIVKIQKEFSFMRFDE